VPVEPTQLLGLWHLARRIVDRRPPGPATTGPQFGRVSGTLTFTLLGPGEIEWSERGTLAWGGQQLAVTRTLRVRSAGGAWTVCFDDGRPFHPWSPGAPLVHPCRADTYRGVVDVADDLRRLRVLWDVSGPAKDTRLFTRCTRADRDVA
jgi:hypothetical protein